MKYCNILDKEDIRPKIEESLRRTKETNKEHGFNFCVANETALTTYVEGGEKDSIGIGNRCPKGAKVLGGFHVHTKPSLNKDAVPSPADIKKGISEKMAFFCIGANVNDKGIVRCFGKEDLESEIADNVRRDKLKKLGLGEIVEDIDRSIRLITGRMTVYGAYLDKHSCQRIYV